MAQSRRCSVDDINYPVGTLYERCAVCGRPTWLVDKQEPDKDWQAQVAKAKQVEFELAPLTEALPAVSRDRIVRFRDQLWVASENLFNAGYKPGYLRIGAIILVAERRKDPMYFELDGYVMDGELTGWWINPIHTEGWVPDAPPE